MPLQGYQLKLRASCSGTSVVKMAAPTSFVRTTPSRWPRIRGTKPSVHNAQLLVSTGAASLDHLLGGGLAVGTILMIEEDTYGSYAKMLLKYFLAEGIQCGHSLHVCALDVTPEELVSQLPAPVMRDSTSEDMEAEGDSTPMQIAWRYSHNPRLQSSGSSDFSHQYDLSKKIPQHLIQEAHVTYWRDPNVDLIRSIQTEIQSQELGTTDRSAGKIMRIGIHSFGSPYWSGRSRSKFLMRLRATLRSSFAVAVVTMPTHLFPHDLGMRRCEHMCDTVIRLESFEGSDQETNPVFKDYQGLFHLVKLPTLNSLVGHIPETFDLAFKLRKRKFVIEKLHLPPELPETTEREQDEPVMPSCGRIHGKKIDF